MMAAAALDATDPSLIAAFDAEDPGSIAFALAAYGMAVFPLHTPQGSGGCSCGRRCGRTAGKHPRTRRGLHDATTDPQVITAWWARWPEANLAVRTGVASGLVVLDVDAGSGDATIAALEAEQGELSPTWAVETGGGGLHLWHQHPGGTIPCSVGRLGPGLDVRGDGGYIVAPPSLHRSGERYYWGAAWHPAQVPLAPAPPWLLTLISQVSLPESQMIPPEPGSLRGQDGGNHVWGEAAAIPEGSRNVVLTSLAGTMRRRSFSAGAILAALQTENTDRCAPPLPAAEVTKIARSVARYAPDSEAAATMVSAARDLRSPGPRRGGFVEFIAGRAVRR